MAGVSGANFQDCSNWWSQICAQFDEVAPGLTEVNVPVQQATVVALFMETDRAPFVVRNPAHGTKGGGPVTWEVPWREGASTRSSTQGRLSSSLGATFHDSDGRGSRRSIIHRYPSRSRRNRGSTVQPECSHLPHAEWPPGSDLFPKPSCARITAVEFIHTRLLRNAHVGTVFERIAQDG
jgi:hypothetical protein